MFTSVTHIRLKTSWTILQRKASLYFQYSMPQDEINSHNMTTRQKLRSCARHPEVIRVRVTNDKPLYNVPRPYTTTPVTSELLCARLQVLGAGDFKYSESAIFFSLISRERFTTVADIRTTNYVNLNKITIIVT